MPTCRNDMGEVSVPLVPFTVLESSGVHDLSLLFFFSSLLLGNYGECVKIQHYI